MSLAAVSGGQSEKLMWRRSARGSRTSRRAGLVQRLEILQSVCYNIRMNTELKIRKIGNSAGVVLPKELLAHLDAEVGATLSVSKTPHGIELSVRDPEFEGQMAAAREIMARRKRALRELAATEDELTEAIMRDDREMLRALAKR